MPREYSDVTFTDNPGQSTMKYFLLLFLVGIASAASIYQHDDFAVAASYMDVLELEDFPLAAVGADEEPSDLEKKLRDKFDETIEKIKDLIEQGKNVGEDLLDKAKELREKLKDLKVKISDKAKEMLEKIKDKAKDWVQKLLDKLSGKEKRFVKQALKEMFKKLRDSILDKFNKEDLKAKIEEIFGHGSLIAEKILEFVKEKGEKAKQKLLDFIDRILGDKDEREERSIAEMWEKVKNFFKDMQIELKEKYLKFGEWVRENLKNLLDKAKDKHEKIKEIAQQLKDHIKDVSKDIAVEGLEFLRPYKEDLGDLWEQLKDAVKEIIGKKD